MDASHAFAGFTEIGIVLALAMPCSSQRIVRDTHGGHDYAG